MQLRVLREQTLRITVTAGSLYRMVITAVPFLLPLQFQFVFGWTPLGAGLMVAALFVGNLTIKPATTPLMRRFGIRNVLLVNAIASVGCFGLLALLRPGLPIVVMAAILYVSGALRSIGFTAYASLAYSGIEGDDLTPGTPLTHRFRNSRLGSESPSQHCFSVCSRHTRTCIWCSACCSPPR